MIIELRCVEMEKKELKVPIALKEVVKRHQAIFENPKGPPPSREKDHTIVLKEGTNPVSVRPYHYPQIQKDEIEKMARDMLQDQFVRPSTNPCSIPGDSFFFRKKRWFKAFLCGL